MCASLIAGIAGCRVKGNSSGDAPSKGVRSAAKWLWEKQQDDGGWHSSTYGLLKSGQALTPFILHTLLRARSQFQPPEKRVQQAIQFIQQHTHSDGVLGVADPDLLEYPNYSTAYAVLCLQSVAHSDRKFIARMCDYLVQQQFNEHGGFDPSHAAYGAWGFGGQRSPACFIGTGRTTSGPISRCRRQSLQPRR